MTPFARSTHRGALSPSAPSPGSHPASASRRPGSWGHRALLAGAALGLSALIAGCSVLPAASRTFAAQVSAIDGTTVTADVLEETPEELRAAGDAGANPAPEAPGTGGAVSYEAQPAEVFTVGDESVYATDAAQLQPTTQAGAQGLAIRIEDNAIAEAPEGVSLDSGTLTIANGGTYELSGSFEGTVDITAADEVRLQLSDLSLTGSAAPLVRSAGTLVLELKGANRLTANEGAESDESAEGNDDVTAAVDAQGALFIEGDGSLELAAPSRGFSAQTMLGLDGGTVSVTSGDDALFSASDLRISGGSLKAEAGDDVAHGDLVLVVEGGSIEGSGEEGFEGEKIYLREGTATLTTSDDGINAAEPEAHDEGGAPEDYSEAESCLIAIGGGTMTVNAKGDGIDSNGSIEITGGQTYVSALAPGEGEANAPLDYDGAGVLSGGTLLMTGDGSMAQGFTKATQAYVLARASGTQGQEVALVSASGQTLASHTAEQDFDVVIATAPGLEDGETVQVSVGSEAVEATATTEAQSAMPGGGTPQGGAPGNGGANGAGGQPPEPPSGGQGQAPGQDGGTPPEPPSGAPGQGGEQNGTPSEPPSGNSSQGSGDQAAAQTGSQQGQGTTLPEQPQDQSSSDQSANGDGASQPPELPANQSTGTSSDGQPAEGDATATSSAEGATSQNAPDAPDATGSAGAANGTAAPGNAPKPPAGNTTTPTGETITFTVSEEEAKTLEVGSIVIVTLGQGDTVESLEVVGNGNGMPGGGNAPSGAPGASTETFGAAATTIDTDQTVNDKTYSSTATDENALRVTNGATTTLDALTVTKSGDSTNTDASNFYGLNAGILANSGAKATIANATVTTDATGANGIFSYGEGTEVTVSDTTIRTSGNSSGGIETAGGATTQASGLDIETQGASSAAIRSDRGGGTVNVEGGSYVTHGTGSPAIYSTADISVKDATLTATASEGVVVEGKNSVSLENCELSGTMQGTYGENSDENLQGVMIYQSMSGDAEVGQASFGAKGGSITTNAGDLFYVTNTTCAIDLEDVDLGLASDADGTEGALLRVAGNDGSRGWGQQGSNGGTCAFTATNQKLAGAIVVDDISELTLTLASGSAFEGSVNTENSGGTVDVTLEEGTWTLTADSYLSSFEGDLSQVATNGHHLFVAGEQVL